MSSQGGQGAAVRSKEGSVARGRGRAVLWCVVQARCEVSAVGGDEDGGRAASMSPHRLRSPLCSHTPAETKKEKISVFSTL